MKLTKINYRATKEKDRGKDDLRNANDVCDGHKSQHVVCNISNAGLGQITLQSFFNTDRLTYMNDITDPVLLAQGKRCFVQSQSVYVYGK